VKSLINNSRDVTSLKLLITKNRSSTDFRIVYLGRAVGLVMAQPILKHTMAKGQTQKKRVTMSLKANGHD